jgi:hypothetical protein
LLPGAGVIDRDRRRRDHDFAAPPPGVGRFEKGLFSVNFTNDTNKFQRMTEEQLITAITSALQEPRDDPDANT